MSCYFLILSDIAIVKDVTHYIQTEDPVKDDTKELKKKVCMVNNIRWKDLGHLFAVWIMILALEIGKVDDDSKCLCFGTKLHDYWLWSILGSESAPGLGGGFISAPLFLGIGIPPQVASATSISPMAFSASMVVVEYYLLKRFPVPYGKYA
ncbi:hypothetical protein V8G54_036512 [Vigna mungo]|uniref:Uncharacterized protein n=1 Tax=Vigna mungo TaxID=3915 RepID=A0AAQ3MHU0_VIGMU